MLVVAIFFLGLRSVVCKCLKVGVLLVLRGNGARGIEVMVGVALRPWFG
jgi:hypothetical protein